MAHPKFDTLIPAVVVASVALGIAVVSAGCGSRSHSTGSADRSMETSQAAAGNAAQPQRPEQKSGETKSVQPQVQTEIGKAGAEKRATPSERRPVGARGDQNGARGARQGRQ